MGGYATGVVMTPIEKEIMQDPDLAIMMETSRKWPPSDPAHCQDPMTKLFFADLQRMLKSDADEDAFLQRLKEWQVTYKYELDDITYQESSRTLEDVLNVERFVIALFAFFDRRTSAAAEAAEASTDDKGGPDRHHPERKRRQPTPYEHV